MSRGRRNSSASPAGRRLGPTFAVGFGGFFLLTAICSLAAPLTSSPDESNHIVRAVSLDAGQLLGRRVPNEQPAEVLVRVPATFRLLEQAPKCYQLEPGVSAACQKIVGSPAVVETGTYVGRYPPAYYAVVGMPSLFSSTPGVVYAMRLVSAAISSALLALALALALCLGAGTALAGGVLLAAVPQVFYEASVVQPSGFEISSALCLWVALVLVFWRRPDEPLRPAVVHAAGASALCLVLARNISPLWCGLIGLVVLAGARSGTIVGAARRRDVRVWSAVVVAAGVFQVAWDEYAHAFYIYGHRHSVPTSHLEALGRALDLTPSWVLGMVSNFGFRGNMAPAFVFGLVAVAVGVTVVLGLILGDGRRRLSVVLAVAGSLVIPLSIVVWKAASDGEGWSGRYTLPFAVGIPITAAAAMRLSRTRATLFVDCAAGCWAVVTVTTIWAELRRYSVGDRGPLDLILTPHPSWQPPLSLPVLALGSLVVPVAIFVWVCLAGRVRAVDQPPVSPVPRPSRESPPLPVS